jgi:hypothetical protein
LQSFQTITADSAGSFAGTRARNALCAAPGALFRELSRMFGNAVAIANNILVLLARHSPTNVHLLVYGAGLRLTTLSRNFVRTSFSMRLPTGGYWSSRGMAFEFSEELYHG